MRRRIVAVFAAIVLILGVSGYALASNAVYDKLSGIDASWCPWRFAADTPASFTTDHVDGSPRLDLSAYSMPGYQSVSFASRGQAAITISGWWVPGATAAAPAVVVAHGFGRCKHDPEVLLPAAMLHRAGFSVLLIDMRNHGDSTVDDGRFAAGVKEYRDVLGAFDWLRTVQGLAADRIGLFGVSGGAGTVVIASGEEPQVAAVWEDSGWGDVDVGMQDELTREGFPTFLSFGALLVGRLLHGVDLTALSPLKAAAALHGRPIYIVHGMADTRNPVKQAYLLADGVRQAGGTVDPWILPGVGHVRAAFLATAEYERRLVDFFSRALGSPTS
jgi:dipeptidyl aminopeptidase/acylaminoacyl peptidase